MDDQEQELTYKRMSHVTDEYSSSSSISSSSKRRVWVAGPIIVGAGPSGLAVAACLKERGIPRLILERSDCIASLWKYKTYDRLRLHLPKQFCQLPLFPFPPDFPTYPTKQDFVAYLESYAAHFNLNPLFNRTVVGAEFVDKRGFWSVTVAAAKKKAARGGGNRIITGSGVGEQEGGGEEVVVVVEYVCPWLIVATGENAEAVVPDIDGLNDFVGDVVHTSCFKSGLEFMGKRVLVVGCGNSGMEVCLDLCNHNALPSLVVRDSVHVLPQEMIGTSTFGLSVCLLKWFPVRLVDKFLLLMSRLMIGDTDRIGLSRPSIGPLEWKNISGKTPVLDIGTLDKIKAGIIKVLPEIKKITSHGAEFTDGKLEDFGAIIFATGYKSNVSNWLKDNKMFSERDGFPVKSFPDGWKGEDGLYAVGFTKHGLLGASLDAVRIAEDIELTWKIRAKRHTGCAHVKFTKK